MTNPEILLDAVVDKLRSIEGLADSMEGDLDRIFAYKDAYPQEPSLARAVVALKPPAVMVAHIGSEFAPPGTPGSFWTHRFQMFLRPRQEQFDGEREGPPPDSYMDLIRKIANGTVRVNGADQRWLFACLADGTYAIEGISFNRTPFSFSPDIEVFVGSFTISDGNP